MQSLNKIVKVIKELYQTQFGRKPPKYLKFIILIAFGGIGFCILRNLFWKILNKLRSYPPGPLGLPFIGCLLHFGVAPRAFLSNIAKTFGPITYVPLLATNNIFISDPKVLRQLYVNEKILNRPPIATRPRSAFFEISGHDWVKRRKYASTTVLNLTKTSFILSHVKQCINDYIEPLINDECIKNNKLWYPSHHIDIISFNNMFAAIFDHILPFNHPFVKEYSYYVDKGVQAAGLSYLMDIATNFQIIHWKWLKYKISWNIADKLDELMVKWMNNNGFTIDCEKNILYRNEEKKSENNYKVYIDYLISKLQQDQKLTVIDIIGDVQTILGAGIDTTSKATEYGFLLLAKYPNIQEIVYNELQNVMKKNNLKEFNFKILNELHVFRAFIHEVLRISCIGPIGVPHITNTKHIIDIDGGKKIVIPKNTVCLCNTYFIHKYLDWNNDGIKVLKNENNSIHLEYWLNKDKKFKMNDNFVLFGVGKRNCVGQSLAMKSIYAIFGLMINKYKFNFDDDSKDTIIKQEFGFVLYIKPPIGIRLASR